MRPFCVGPAKPASRSHPNGRPFRGARFQLGRW